MTKPKNQKNGVAIYDFDGVVRPFDGLKLPINPGLLAFWVNYDKDKNTDSENYQVPEEYINKLESAISSIAVDFIYKGGYRGKEIDYENYVREASIPTLNYSEGKRKNALSKRTNGFYDMLVENEDLDQNLIEVTKENLDTFWTSAVSASHQLLINKFVDHYNLDEGIGLENKTDSNGVYTDERKINMLPPDGGKGKAIDYLKEKYPDLIWDFSVAIGDSATHDKPLFDAVEVPILYAGRGNNAEVKREKAKEKGWEYAENAEEVRKILQRERENIQELKESGLYDKIVNGDVSREEALKVKG